tara:strand:+ start:2271 stop:2447 length:177 start_codon:yes stop_codon:yes gene_type:complete
MKQTILNFMQYIKNILPKLTPKNTIMWIEVPMSANSRDEKRNIILATISQLEQTIKIN